MSVPKVRYRLYHSNQPGFEHGKGCRRFSFYPQSAFRPMGVIIFGANDAILHSVVVGTQEQLIASIPADMMGPKGLTIEQLEMLVRSSSMQSALSSRGIPSLALPTADIGMRFGIEVSEPVDIVVFWGIEADNG